MFFGLELQKKKMKRSAGKEQDGGEVKKKQKATEEQPPSIAALIVWRMFFSPEAAESSMTMPNIRTAETLIKFLCRGVHCCQAAERKFFEQTFLIDGPSRIQRLALQLSPGLAWHALMDLMRQLYEHLSVVPESAQHRKQLVSSLDFNPDQWEEMTLFPKWYHTRNLRNLPAFIDAQFRLFPMFPDAADRSVYRFLYQDNNCNRWISLLHAWEFVSKRPASLSSLADEIHLWCLSETKHAIKMRRLQSQMPYKTTSSASSDPTLVYFGEPGPWSLATKDSSALRHVMELLNRGDTSCTWLSAEFRVVVGYLDQTNCPLPLHPSSPPPPTDVTVKVKPEGGVNGALLPKRELFSSHMKRASKEGLRIMPHSLAAVPAASNYYKTKQPTIKKNTEKQLLAYVKQQPVTFSDKTKLTVIDDPKYQPAALRGQLGVRCVQRLKEGDIVGEYTGLYRLAPSTPAPTTSRYVYGFVYDGISYEIDGDPDGRDNDGLSNTSCIVTRVNDYRRDVQTVAQGDFTYKNDDNRINCQFINVVYNGEPFVFLIAVRDVAAGEWLLTDYGEEYWRHLIGSSSSTPFVF